LPWLAGWLRACRPQRALDVSAALRALHVPVFDNYAALLGAAGMADLVRRSGQLYVSARPDGALGDAFVRELRERAGLEVEALSGGALRELEPALGEQYRSGLYFRRNGHCVNPLRLVKALAEAFRRGGGTILRRTVSGFENGPGGPRRLLTDAGALPLQTVVIAAGAWSARLAAGLGMRFPLEAERGYHLMLPAPGVMPRIPLVNRDHHFTVTPMENGLRLAGTAEFAGLDAAPDYRRSRMLLERARRMLPGVDGSGASEWMGCRPSLPDGLPVIGRAPHRPSVLLAFGHAHFGLTEAPTTGRLIADLVAGREPAIDIGPYRAQRFLRGE
jgi:D-amino-acid dehydrogenase